MSVMIGIDPHKATHTAAALDGDAVELGRLRLRAGQQQVPELLRWAERFGPRVWAVESAQGMGYLLAQQLVAAGERVVDVPATLASRVRVLSSGKSTKNDPNDARAVAVAALHAPSLNVVRAEDHATVCRLLVKHAYDLGRWRNKQCCRLHVMVNELVPGGISKEVVVSQARSLLADLEPSTVAGWHRRRLALELVEDIAQLDQRIRASRVELARAVRASGTTLTELYGVGPYVAAMVIGYSGDPFRFATPARFAAYNGTAPVEFSSGGRTIYRLSRRGNRRLNHALHIAAVTQIRHRGSEGRVYFDRKVAEGKTPHEALRALKRRISDRVWRRLVNDALHAALP